MKNILSQHLSLSKKIQKHYKTLNQNAFKLNIIGYAKFHFDKDLKENVKQTIQQDFETFLNEEDKELFLRQLHTFKGCYQILLKEQDIADDVAFNASSLSEDEIKFVLLYELFLIHQQQTLKKQIKNMQKEINALLEKSYQLPKLP